MARWYTPPTICPRSGSDAPLAQAEREIANYPRAIAKGDFSLLEQALGATEQRRATIQAELAKFDGEQPSAVIQLPPRSSGTFRG